MLQHFPTPKEAEDFYRRKPNEPQAVLPIQATLHKRTSAVQTEHTASSVFGEICSLLDTFPEDELLVVLDKLLQSIVGSRVHIPEDFIVKSVIGMNHLTSCGRSNVITSRGRSA